MKNINFLLVIGFLFFLSFFSCENLGEGDTVNKITPSFDFSEDANLNRVDSLIKNFQFLRADEVLDSLLLQDNSYSQNVEFNFLRVRLNYLYKRSFPEKYKTLEINNLKIENERDQFLIEMTRLLLFHYKNLEQLEEGLLQYEQDSIKDVAILQSAYYVLAEYYQTMQYDEDIAISYSNKLLKLCNEYTDFGDYYFVALENLVNLELINRDISKADAYADKYIFSRNLHHSQNDLLKARALYLKGYTQCYMGEPDYALDILYIALKSLPRDSCLYDKQEILKLILFASNYFKKWDIYDKNILVLEEELLYCKDYCNLNKIKGDNAFMQGHYRESVPLYLEAYSFIIRNRPLDIPQLGTVLYYLQEAYLSLGEFDKALDVYYTETVDPLPNTIAKWDKDKIFEKDKIESTYYFMIIEQYARVFYKKYLFWKDKNDLFIAKELLDSSRVFIQKETETHDEDRLLSIFEYTEGVYDLGMLINRELHNLFEDKIYLSQIYQCSEESKLKILYSLIHATSDDKWEGIKIQRSIDSLILNNRSHSEVIKKKNQIDSLQTTTKQIIKESNLITKVQKNLENDEILIDYNIIDDEIFIHYIYKDSSILYISRYGETESTRIKEVVDSHKSLDLDSIKIYEKDVFSILFPNPNLPYHITISPDQELLNLNFEALKDDSSQDLIDNHLIVYSGAGGQFRTTTSTHINKSKKIAAFFYSDSLSINDAPVKLDELPGNIPEKNLIKKLFPNSKIYSGKQNTKNNFLTAIIDQSLDIIHISTHGFSSDNTAKDIRLYFRDNQYNLDSIFAYNLLDIKLKADLVILSSCDSGSGLLFKGEGKFDWARYFILAGARSVISSLWEVDDNASKLIFNYFYTSKKPSYEEKIREAKIKLKKNPKYSHPYYWGGFVFSS